MKKRYVFIICVVFIILLIIQRECTREQPREPGGKPDTTTTITDQSTDHPIDAVIIKPDPIRVIDSIPYEVKQTIDTAAILEQCLKTTGEYYKKREYDIPIRDDSTAKLNLLASVYKNELIRAEVKGKVTTHQRTIIKNVMVPTPPRNKLFVGITIDKGINNEYFGISPEIMLLTKKDHGYFVKYDPLNHVAGGGMYFKISFSRK